MEQLLAEAVAHHQAGRLPEAEQGYRQVLAIEPRHADALHLLGLIAHQVGRNDIAVDLIGQAIAVQAGFAPYRSSLGAALLALGRGAEALAAFDAALGLNPGYAEGHSNRGNALKALGRGEDALAAYETALRLNPALVEARYNQGGLLKELGRSEEAVAAYRAVLRARPDFADAHAKLGSALLDLGRPEEAVAAYEAALALRPNLAETHYNLAGALKALGRVEQALAAYDAALGLKPDFAEAHSNRGTALAELGRHEEAVQAYDAALGFKPDFADAHANRGNALHKLGLIEDAAAAQEAAIRCKPDFAEAHYNLANALNALGRLDDAVAAYEAAIRLRPGYAEAHFNEAFCHFLRGDMPAAWSKYEWRWRGGCPGLAPRDFAPPQWRGEDLAGRTILLHAEQGLGDAIQFCRYAPLVAARGARVVLEAPRHVLRLLSGLDGVDALVAAGDPLPAFDLHCPLMSLPGAFGTTAETIPADIPYLKAEDGEAARWRKRIGPDGFRIGIAWQGNPTAAAEQGRSAPLAGLAPLAAVPGVRLISLQKVHGLDQLQRLPPGMRVETLGEDFDAGPDAFVDTAAAMTSLDLIVTVDTAVGHLAGALGRPVWLALQAVPHWIWMMEREDSPWYPNHRLFRQTARGDWDGVFERMARALPGLVAALPRLTE